jgi:hypothetical protein
MRNTAEHLEFYDKPLIIFLSCRGSVAGYRLDDRGVGV